MLRTLLFLFVITVFGLLGNWLINHNGTLSITWLGYRIDTTSTFALILLAGAVAILTVILLLLTWIKHLPSRISGTHAFNKREAGLTALTRGFAAIAAGDLKLAQKLIKKAEHSLGETPLVLLLQTQAAQLEGNDTSARLYLTSMTKHKETELIALKGLLLSARKEGNIAEALTYAERAYKLNADANWISPVLVDLYKLTSQWDKARNILEQGIKHHKLDKEQAKHDLGTLLLMEGKTLATEGKLDEAYNQLKQAKKYLPDSVPLTIQLCAVLKSMDKKRKPAQLIETLWKTFPHPNLVKSYLSLFDQDPPEKQLKRIESLASGNPDHYESHIAIAKAAIAAQSFSKARNHLKLLALKQETVEVCKLMAEVEKQDGGNATTIHEWLAKATHATPNPAWVCNHCNYTSKTWEMLCPNCNTFDSFAWKQSSSVYAIKNTPSA